MNELRATSYIHSEMYACGHIKQCRVLLFRPLYPQSTGTIPSELKGTSFLWQFKINIMQD